MLRNNFLTDLGRKTLNITNNKKLSVLCGLLILVLASSAHAQPQVEIEFESMFGQFSGIGEEAPPNGFSSPTGVTFNANDDILIADRGHLQVQRCDLQGNCNWMGIFAFRFRNQPGSFDLPHGIEANRNGLYAVADEDNHAVQLCTLSQSCEYKGETISENNPPQTGFGRWAFPSDVAFDSQNRVYGLDTGNNRVQILRADNLDFAGQFGSSVGSSPPPPVTESMKPEYFETEVSPENSPQLLSGTLNPLTKLV